MHQIADWLTETVSAAPAWAVYLVVFAVVCSETAILVCGLVLPSEATLLAAGVAAAVGEPNIYVLIGLAWVAALTGDLIGYYLGRRTGPRLTGSWAGRKFGDDAWEQASARVRENVWVTVPIGRWIGYVRTLVPIAAGMADVPVHRYAPATFLGGATWSTAVLSVAYVLGATAGVRLMGLLVVGLIAGGLVIMAVRFVRHRARVRRTADPGGAAG